MRVTPRQTLKTLAKNALLPGICLALLIGCEPQAPIERRALLVDGAPFDIKGICWNPVPKGHTHPTGLAFDKDSDAYSLDFIEKDLKLIAAAGFNTLRIYEPIIDREVLNLIQSYGLKIIVPAFIHHAISDAEIESLVLSLRNHPAILFWEIGNEWNYNNFYNSQGSYEQSVTRLNEVIDVIRSADSRLPISTNYGEIPSPELVNTLDVDIWGLNIYRSADFGDVFDRWEGLSDKPMYIGEYGADAIDNRNDAGLYTPYDQEFAVVQLTKQIIFQYASEGRGPVLGGALFEFSDEWWKDGSGSPDRHEIGGVAPGGGPYPDLEFNEEWWGIVDIERNPRPAYHAIKDLYRP